MTREAEALMREFEGEHFHPWTFSFRIMDHLPLDRVDEFMAALPEDVREIAIAHVQNCYASEVELVRFAQQTEHDSAAAAALCDWVKRQGRFHHPRRADEPDVKAAEKRLGAPDDDDMESILREKPFKALSWFGPDELDERMASLKDENRRAVVTWAVQHFSDAPVPATPRPKWARPGSEAAMIAWLRRNGHLR